jgi:YCII-related domain
VYLQGSRLGPSREAATVRAGDGELLVTDGPFAETKEQVAGFDIIEYADLQEAIQIAGRHDRDPAVPAEVSRPAITHPEAWRRHAIFENYCTILSARSYQFPRSRPPCQCSAADEQRPSSALRMGQRMARFSIAVA